MLKTIVFAPLVGAAILGFFGKRMPEKMIGAIACLAVFVSVVASFLAFNQLLHAPAQAPASAQVSAAAPESANEKAGEKANEKAEKHEGVRRLVEPVFTWMAV